MELPKGPEYRREEAITIINQTKVTDHQERREEKLKYDTLWERLADGSKYL